MVRVRWASNLTYFDSVRDVTYDDWRLPTVTDIGNDGCNWGLSGTDCGYNVVTSTGEMASIWYDTLGNTAQFDASGSQPSGWGLTHTGPLTNLQSDYYWSGTEYEPDTNTPWFFYVHDGLQYNAHKTNEFYAWAVRSGDVSAVPIPGAVWLFGSGLMGLVGWSKRRALTSALRPCIPRNTVYGPASVVLPFTTSVPYFAR